MHLSFNIENIKIYIKTLLYSHSYMFRSARTIIRESILSQTSKVLHLEHGFVWC